MNKTDRNQAAWDEHFGIGSRPRPSTPKPLILAGDGFQADAYRRARGWRGTQGLKISSTRDVIGLCEGLVILTGTYYKRRDWDDLAMYLDLAKSYGRLRVELHDLDGKKRGEATLRQSVRDIDLDRSPQMDGGGVSGDLR